MKSPRRIAAEALIKVDRDGAYSNIVISNELRREPVSNRDKAFATALFYGVLERKITLDHIISGYIKRPLEKLDLEVLEVLRLSIYQLGFMDSVPDSAAVNEGVKLIKEMKKTSCAPLVNAVLRNFLRDGKKLYNIEELDIQKRLSIVYSVSPDIAKVLIRDYGQDRAEKILEASFRGQSIIVRVNTLMTTADGLVESLMQKGIIAKKSDILANAIEIDSCGDLTVLDEFKKGMFHVQDTASQLCSLCLMAKENDVVYDMCAAPGGKSFTMAEQMKNKGRILSFDIHENKLSLIKSGAERLGITIIEAVQNDASIYNEKLIMADKVLCDVPCSGLGILSKKPEIRYKSAKAIDSLLDLQYHILCISSRYVKSGGTIVYSTCTLNKDENEKIVDKFLSENDCFEPLILPIGDKTEYRHTFLPDAEKTDGFFVCAMKRIR